MGEWVRLPHLPPNTMIKQLKDNAGVLNIVSLIGTAFAVLFYLQANFVQASEFTKFKVQEWEDQIYKLVIKENRLASEGKKLKPEEKAYLEMLKARLAKEK